MCYFTFMVVKIKTGKIFGLQTIKCLLRNEKKKKKQNIQQTTTPPNKYSTFK